MNIKIADEQFERLTKNVKLVKDSKTNQNIIKRIKKLFREGYASGFSDGVYKAQDEVEGRIYETFNKLQPNYDGLLGVGGKDKKW